MFSLFQDCPGLVVGLSQKEDGSMKVVSGAAEVVARRNDFLRRNNIAPEQFISVSLVHGSDVVRVGTREAGLTLRNVDGLVTSERGLALGITVADCLPIFLYSPDEERIGIVHAGWRGLSRGIIGKAVSWFEKLSQVRVGIGPSIQRCHYEVGDEVAAVFAAYPNAFDRKGEQTFLSLQEVAKEHLVASGVAAEYTEVSSECTACLSEKYFSYRRDKPADVEAMLAYILLR